MQSHAGLVQGVLNLAARVQADAGLSNLIRRKFSIKCTTGYSLNALVDFPLDDPIEIIKRLMIGSEGTLGFVSRATYNTVPEWPNKVSSYLRGAGNPHCLPRGCVNLKLLWCIVRVPHVTYSGVGTMCAWLWHYMHDLFHAEIKSSIGAIGINRMGGGVRGRISLGPIMVGFVGGGNPSWDE